MKRFLTVLSLLALSATALWGTRLALFMTRPRDPQSQNSAVILVKRGASPAELTRTLQNTGVIEDADRFLLGGKILRRWNHVKAGEYRLFAKMTPLEILGVLESGISVNYSVTIHEGDNIFEIAQTMSEQGLADRARILELCKSPEFMGLLGLKDPLPPSMEGYLFPDTYFFSRTMSPEDMLRQMHRRFKSLWTADLAALAQRSGLNRHEVLTLASIIEKETGAPEERPIISSVFHNRLRKKMRLQSDPTTIYGIWETYSGNIHKKDLLTPTPFNTYTVAALPIGPISNPGVLAIRAAMSPAQSEYLFFVSQNDGRHVFTRTFAEHSEAVKKFQLDRKAREGKSWRDLNRKKEGESP